MKLAYTPEARRDLIRIGIWIARDDPRTAERFVAAIEAACEAILDIPEGYPEVIVGGRVVRRKNFRSYRIFYQVFPDRVRIVSIMHAARLH